MMPLTRKQKSALLRLIGNQRQIVDEFFVQAGQLQSSGNVREAARYRKLGENILRDIDTLESID